MFGKNVQCNCERNAAQEWITICFKIILKYFFKNIINMHHGSKIIWGDIPSDLVINNMIYYLEIFYLKLRINKIGWAKIFIILIKVCFNYFHNI